MQRFFGMMPNDEIEKEVNYRDSNGLGITIQSGPNGWTILWADGSSTYADKESTTEKNFEAAYDTCTRLVGDLQEINTPMSTIRR